jgi:CubicO group peptidase (beta-lactamase class C family)
MALSSYLWFIGERPLEEEKMIPWVRLSIVVVCFCLLFGSVAWTDGLPSVKPEDVGFSSPRLERIGAVLGADIEKGRIPGAVVFIARKGKIAYFEGFGMRDKEARAPMQKDSIFRIYSMTKPIVSVGVMMLCEEGRITLTEPASKYLPELGGLKVGVEGTNSLTGKSIFYTVPAQRDMTIQDLLRHTSGLSCESLAKSPTVRSMYQKADLGNHDETAAEMTQKVGKLPLAYHPGTQWEYGVSTDVLGRLIEVVSGMPLDRFLEGRVLRPLQMEDTGFYVRPEKRSRIAEGARDPKTGQPPDLMDVTKPPKFLSGAGGMVSTAMDYARFLQMLLNKGTLDGIRLLSRKTVGYMTADHLGPLAARSDPGYIPGPGYGFGLGFAVRQQDGLSHWPGTVDDYWWAGYGGTYFWVDPQEEMVVVFMMQAIAERGYYRALLRNLVYQAIDD